MLRYVATFHSGVAGVPRVRHLLWHPLQPGRRHRQDDLGQRRHRRPRVRLDPRDSRLGRLILLLRIHRHTDPWRLPGGQVLAHDALRDGHLLLLVPEHAPARSLHGQPLGRRIRARNTGRVPRVGPIFQIPEL